MAVQSAMTECKRRHLQQESECNTRKKSAVREGKEKWKKREAKLKKRAVQM